MATRIFIGTDPREQCMTKMCRRSIERNTRNNVKIDTISNKDFSRSEFWRDSSAESASTQFTFSRFLVPHVCKFRGWALFVDCDFIFTADVMSIFNENRGRENAVCCVKHPDYISKVDTKMDGISQQRSLPRKNWASLMLFNCGHPLTRKLTPKAVSEESPDWLFQLKWAEDSVGELSYDWNFLAGEGLYKIPSRVPRAVHYTLFHPELGDNNDNIACEFAPLWYETYEKTFNQPHHNYEEYLKLKEI